jgi:putative FmdB family regulatory protein
MPIYDYQCQSCHYKAEVMRKVSASNVEVCPQCGAEAFSKQLSAPNFQLNGSGWYATDFKNSDNKSKSSSEKNTESPASSGGACQPGCACH